MISGKINNLLKMIDHLLYFIEIQSLEIHTDLDSRHLKLSIEELCPSDISERECYMILKKLHDKNCITSLTPTEGSPNEFGVDIFSKEKNKELRLVVLPNLLNEYKNEIVKESITPDGRAYDINKISFDLETYSLKIDNKKIAISPNTDRADFCRFMFEKKVSVPVDWEDIYKYISGEDASRESKPQLKKIRDLARIVSNLVKHKFNVVESLFTAQRKTVKRNYGITNKKVNKGE